jgi:hypothetical protein
VPEHDEEGDKGAAIGDWEELSSPPARLLVCVAATEVLDSMGSNSKLLTLERTLPWPIS